VDFVTDDDLYDVLGVSPEADDVTIRKAYKKLAVTLHPDRYVDKPQAEREDAQHKFAKVSYAYNVLKDTEKRNEYDFMRRMGVSAPDADPEPPSVSPEEAARRREMAEKRFRQGIALQMEKNIKGALDAFKEAVRIDPSVAQYHTMLAVTYQKMGWVSYAMAEINAALKLDPKDALAIKIRGQLKAQEKAQAEEEEAKDKKGKKKKKGKAEPKGRKASSKTAGTNQLSFKKKRTSLFQSLFGALFGRK